MKGFQLARSWRVLFLGPSAELAANVRTILSQEASGAQLFEVLAYPDAAALPRLLINQSLSVCLLDASSRETALPLIREIQQTAPQLAIVAMLPSDDPDLILGCLRQGAAEFLIHPFTPLQIDLVFQRLAQSRPELADSSGAARVIAVVPAKGACGASTLALNLAFQRKRLGVKKILLADLDPLTGTVSFMLSAHPTYSFLDALARGAALDADVWRGLVQTVDGVDILHAPESITEALYELSDPNPLLDFARHQYELIVVDLASSYGEWNKRVLQSADEVLLVTMSDAGSIRSAQRALRYLNMHRIGAHKLRVVVNRLSREFGVGTDVVQTALQCEIFATVPADYDSVHRALIDGKPIPANTAFGKSLGSLADALVGPKAGASEAAKEAAPKSGALSGLLSLLGRKPTLSR